MGRRAGDFLVYGVVLAGILVLTANPNGAGFVESLGSVLTGFTGAVTGRNVSFGSGGSATKISGKVG